MATRTGAPYTSFEAFVCDRTKGGCGILLYLDEQDQEDIVCGNCHHSPLASVTVTTNDQYSAD